jgi:hypothetical protein
LRRKSTLVAFVALVVVLVGCGDADSQSGSDASPTVASPTVTTEPTPSVAESTAVPTETSAATTSPTVDEPIGWLQFTGVVVAVDDRCNWRDILVVEHPDSPNDGEQYCIATSGNTRIIERTAEGDVPRTLADLRFGTRVAVLIDGPIETSYPAQAGASQIAIQRTSTDGPTDPSDLVTMAFDLSLFVLHGDVQAGDDFFVSYRVGDGDAVVAYFCGDVEPAPKHCAGRGSTYQIQIEVPRGSELHYEVIRTPGPLDGAPELLEANREIMDANLVNQSMFRYGAANPNGYN